MSSANKDSELRQTGLQIALTFGRQFLAGLMQLGIVLTVAKSLGPEGAGIYAVALLVPTMMSQLFNLGLASANVYFIASGQVTLQDAWSASRNLIGVMIIFGLSIGYYFLENSGEKWFPGVDPTILYLALFTYPFSLSVTVTTAFFQAIQDFRAFNLIAIIQPFLALIGIGALMTLGLDELHTIFLIILMAHAVSFGLALSLISRKVRVFQRANTQLKYLRPAIIYGLKAHISNILTFLNYRLDLFLVNLLAGSAAAGFYNVAVRLVEQLWIISKAASTVIFPRLSAMAGNEIARKTFTPLMTRIILWATLLAAIVLAAISNSLIKILFGAEFIPANLALLIMLPGVTAFSAARVLSNDLASRGMVGINLGISAFVLIFNASANVILIPKFGIAGAATATTIAYGISLIILLGMQEWLFNTTWWKNIVPEKEDIKILQKMLKQWNLKRLTRDGTE